MYQEINEILRIAGVKLNESYDRMNRPFIWNDPTYSQFHRILRDNTTYGKLSAIIDNGHIYCWDSALSHHDSVVKDIEESGIKLSDDYIWVRFKEPNLCWVSAAYFDDYTDEDLEDLPQQDFEKELGENPIIKKYFPQGVKVVRFDSINESIEYAESNYGDLYMVIYKNPSRKELAQDKYQQFRVIEDNDGNWYFANAHDYVHAEIKGKLEEKGIEIDSDYNWGFDVILYDNDKNIFTYRTDAFVWHSKESIEGKKELYNDFKQMLAQKFGSSFGNFKVCISSIEEPWIENYTDDCYFGE